MNRYLLNISYIGTKFRGIQKTINKAEEIKPDRTTIQGCIEIGLETLKPVNPIVTHLSSRTDAGVHALNSTVHVDLQKLNGQPYTPERITFILNKLFDKNSLQIRVNSTLHVPNTFHCRYNAKGRTYLYRLAVFKNIHSFANSSAPLNSYIPIDELDRCCFLQCNSFNLEDFQKLSKLFLGKHDFRTFMSTAHNKQKLSPTFTQRSISEISISKSKSLSIDADTAHEYYDYYNIIISGRSFLYKQVRRIVGALIAASTGRIEKKDIYEMITIPSKNTWNPRVLLMPASGLYLYKVHYDINDFQFNNDSCHQIQNEFLGSNSAKAQST